MLRAIPIPDPVSGQPRNVPDPDTGQLLPQDGAKVRDSGWWRRCEARGWVRLEEDAPEAPAPVVPPRSSRRKRS